MNSHRQQKRKRVEIIRNQDECEAVNVKNAANGTGQEPRSALESATIPRLDPSIRVHIPSEKMKLQLIPFKKQTRIGLEKDGHKPFLELTLGARKRISSVIRLLNSKWSCSSAMAGQTFMLFPYDKKLEQLVSRRRWTLNDSSLTVWEVYVDVGCPSIFRLRYDWSCNHQQEMLGRPPKSSLREAHTGSEGKKVSLRMLEIPNHQEKLVKQGNAHETLYSDANHQVEHANESCEAIEKQGKADKTLLSDVNELKASDAPSHLEDDKEMTAADPVCPTVPWDDNLTMLSIGGLLSEISLQCKINGSGPSSVSRSGAQPIPLASDASFRDLLSEEFGKMRCSSMKLGNDASLQPFFLGSSDVSIGELFSEASLLSNKKLDTQSTEAGFAQIQSPWDDNFTTLSIGGLLAEASLQAKTGGAVELKESKSSLEPFVPSQSLDSLVPAQLYASSREPKPSMHEPNLSILDAEETCHAFPFQKLQTIRNISTSNARIGSGECSDHKSLIQSQFPGAAEMNNGTVFYEDSCQGSKMDILTGAPGSFGEDSSLWPFWRQSGSSWHAAGAG